MSRIRVRRVLVAITGLVVVGAFVASSAAAAPGLWPAKKGEVCWVAEASGELSFVQARVTNMGDDHYLFHGQAYRLNPPGELQPFDGNAEVNGGSVVGTLHKMELHSDGELESYSGLMTFDLATLDGSADGVLVICDDASPADCEILRTGVIDLWYDDDCDPATLPPELGP